MGALQRDGRAHFRVRHHNHAQFIELTLADVRRNLFGNGQGENFLVHFITLMFAGETNKKGDKNVALIINLTSCHYLEM